MDRTRKQPGLDALASEPSGGGVGHWRGNRLRAAVCVRDLLLAVLGQNQEPSAPLVRHEELWQPRQGPEILPAAKSRLGGLTLIECAELVSILYSRGIQDCVSSPLR